MRFTIATAAILAQCVPAMTSEMGSTTNLERAFAEDIQDPVFDYRCYYWFSTKEQVFEFGQG